MRMIKVGSRQSPLALTQTNLVIELLQERSEQRGLKYDFEVVPIVTKGDRILDVTLSKVGGKGLFVKEIEQALLDGGIDLAVHSMKDMPAELPDGLTIGAITEREDARDCLISRETVGLDELPSGARIGTSSLRRVCQIRHRRPDLQVEPVRGNINSRLRKLDEGEFDAIVLAAAGIHRVGWNERISEYLPIAVSLPSVGQGALGIECRSGDDEIAALLSLIEHSETSRAVKAERAFLHRLNGGCQVPIGAYAVVGDAAGAISLTGMVGSVDGRRILKQTLEGNDPEKLGLELADQLIAQGALELLAAGGEVIE